MGAPFLLTSWQNSFLDLLLDTMLDNCNDAPCSDFSRLTFVFPHNRPQLYLVEHIKKDRRFAKPCILPQFVSAQTLFPALREALFPQATKVAKQLDMVALLLSCVRQLPDAHDLLFRTSKSSDETLVFLPWGIRLAALFEECFTHMIEPGNFLYEEYRVTEYAAKLLQHTGTLFALYKRELEERQWTTPGYDAYKVAQYLESTDELPAEVVWNVLRHKKDTGHQIFIAGLFTLTGAENILFHQLWHKHGAKILLQGDTASNPHWSCRPIFDWAKSWKTSIERLEARNSNPPFENLRCIAGFDLHSQLEKIHGILAEDDLSAPKSTLPDESSDVFAAMDTAFSQPPLSEETRLKPSSAASASQSYAADTVIVLPDTGLLMPALHHLPRKDINISMGYPLNRSSLFDLLDTIIQLQKNKQHGQYYWRDIINLIRHPYIKMLQPAGPNGNASEDQTLSLRKLLHLFEDSLRKSNQVYITPKDFFISLYYTTPDIQQAPKEVFQLIMRLERILLHNFSIASTLLDIAQALHHFSKLLLRYGKQLWKQFPIDAECLFRLHSSVIPELSATALARESFPPDILYSLVHTLIEAERVPFEATPLVGLQILGMLETRLLNFKRVIIPECTEDLLPGATIDDPLLPDPLRLEIGLPSKRRREEVVAYHFFRLLACAGEIILLWQENSETTGLLDAKKRRSRFVEELLWGIEKKLGRILLPSAEKSPLQTLSTKTSPVRTRRTSIANTPEIQEAVRRFLSRPLSSTVLDCYLTCPTKFVLQYILRVAQASEVPEGQDLPKIGNAIHKTLFNFYSSRLGMELPEGRRLFESSFAELLHLFHTTEEYREIRESFPADIYTLFYTSGEIRLRNYLCNQPPTTVLALEQALRPSRQIVHDTLDCRLTINGYADRIDIRQGNVHILDYKTGGSIPEISPALWENGWLWEQAALWAPGAAFDPYWEISKSLRSVQLPLYVILFAWLSPQENQKIYSQLPSPIVKNDGGEGITAAWVAMGSDGNEKSLFTNVGNYEYVTPYILNTIEVLLSFMTKHMLQTPFFMPNEGTHCKWCPYAGRCVASE